MPAGPTCACASSSSSVRGVPSHVLSVARVAAPQLSGWVWRTTATGSSGKGSEFQAALEATPAALGSSATASSNAADTALKVARTAGSRAAGTA